MYAPFRGHVPSGVMVFASPWSAGSWPLQDLPLQGHERSAPAPYYCVPEIPFQIPIFFRIPSTSTPGWVMYSRQICSASS